MSRVSVNDAYLQGTADGIRYVNGTENEYTPAQFEAAIKATKKTFVTKYITVNDTYNAANDGADGYSVVEVNVSGGGTAWLLFSATASEVTT